MNLFKSNRGNEFAELSQQLAAANDALATKVTQLQNENHYLRRANKVQPRLRLVLRAEAGATLIALWHCAGYQTGRRSCLAFGMSERTFFAAAALLKVARLRDGTGNFMTDDPTLIEQRIRTAVAHCKAQPDALIARMPRSKRPKQA